MSVDRIPSFSVPSGTAMPLTDTAVRSAKPLEKQFKLTDERGMYIDERGMYMLVTPSSGKLWRLNYRFDGKRKTMVLGQYPEIPLKQARERRDEARTSKKNEL